MRYPLPDSLDWGIHGYLCLPLPSDKQQRANIVGALSQLLNWYTYERDDSQSGAKTAQAMRDFWLPYAFDIVDECGCSESKVIERIPYIESVYIESDEDMPQFPYYQQVNNIWYLGFPCAPCGGVSWVPIGSGGELGANGGLSGRDPAIPYLPNGATVAGAGGASCFADSAVDYLAEQCAQMWGWTIDATITAIEYTDFFTPITELFDGAALIADALSGAGTMRELTQLGVDALSAIITAPANIAALKARWTFTTIPQYAEIKAWVDGTTFPFESSVAKKAWQVWALRVIMPKHYGALNVMLSECATGNLLSDIAQSTEQTVGGYVLQTFNPTNPYVMVNGIPLPLFSTTRKPSAIIMIRTAPLTDGLNTIYAGGSPSTPPYASTGGGTSAWLMGADDTINWQTWAEANLPAPAAGWSWSGGDVGGLNPLPAGEVGIQAILSDTYTYTFDKFYVVYDVALQ